MADHLSTPAGIERDVRKVSHDEAFEILIGDCMRQEPFPREIQVIGQAIGWAERIKAMAARRGWSIDITIADTPNAG